MDARTQKRLETVRVIRNKKWFTEDLPGPDPWDASVSTRFWRYSVRVWDKALKESYYRGEPADSPRQPRETAVKHHPCYLVRAPLDDALPGQTHKPLQLQCAFEKPCSRTDACSIPGGDAFRDGGPIKVCSGGPATPAADAPSTAEPAAEPWRVVCA